jgi:hypothetical protein
MKRNLSNIMLNGQKADLMNRISELNECIDLIDNKQQFYIK